MSLVLHLISQGFELALQTLLGYFTERDPIDLIMRHLKKETLCFSDKSIDSLITALHEMGKLCWFWVKFLTRTSVFFHEL